MLLGGLRPKCGKHWANRRVSSEIRRAAGRHHDFIAGGATGIRLRQ